MGPDTLQAPERNGVSRRPSRGATTGSRRRWTIPPVRLVGDGLPVPCLDGEQRPYLNLDTGASTNALPAVAERVNEFLPWYSSVHRGAGYKSQQATDAYEQARAAALRFAGRRQTLTTWRSSVATPPTPSTISPTGCASSLRTWSRPR